MYFSTALLLLTLLGVMGFFLGRNKALRLATNQRMHSRPPYHGFYTTLQILLPGLLILLLFFVLQPHFIHQQIISHWLPNDLENSPDAVASWMDRVRLVARSEITASDEWDMNEAVEQYRMLEGMAGWSMIVLTFGAGLFGLRRAWRRITPLLKSRANVERIVTLFLTIASTLSFLITIGIVLALLSEALRFFDLVDYKEFLFGLQWSPQTAIRADQVGGSGAFGAVPLFAGTFMITGIAMLIATPVGLFSAIYLSEFATSRVRRWVKPALEILAGIPTVVYGFFAALAVAPFIADVGTSAGLDVASESALAAGLVMGIMIIPFVSSLSDDVINSVPQSLRDGSLAMGATQTETIKQVVFPAALPGIIGALLLAISRAVGETMIVVMAAGLAANLTANPLEAMTTVTVQIVTLLVGDQEFDSSKTLAAFALGITLLVFTLILNIIALAVVKKYHEKQ